MTVLDDTSTVLSPSTVTDNAGPDAGPGFDPNALEAYAGFVAGQATAAMNAALVSLGDRLGLWKALRDAGPVTADELAARTGLARRYLQEWLSAQAANHFLGYDPTTDRFALSTEAAMVLADDDSAALMIAAFQGAAVVSKGLPTLEHAFRSGEGVAWHDFDAEFFDVQERFSRPFQRQFLVDVWLAGVPGLHEMLRRGANVADVGCGYGNSTILMAEAFPKSSFVGFDFHDHSIARARKAARHAGVANRVEFEMADAAGFPGEGYDAVMFIDSLHDMGDPVAVARHAREALRPGGVLVTADPVAGDSLAENLANPMAGMMYAVSTFLCTPTAVAQHGPYSLGAMAGESAIRQVLIDAGFARVERVAPEAPMNMIIVGHA